MRMRLQQLVRNLQFSAERACERLSDEFPCFECPRSRETVASRETTWCEKEVFVGSDVGRRVLQEPAPVEPSPDAVPSPVVSSPVADPAASTDPANAVVDASPTADPSPAPVAPSPAGGISVHNYDELVAAVASNAPEIIIAAPFTVQETVKITYTVTISSSGKFALGCPPALNSAFSLE